MEPYVIIQQRMESLRNEEQIRNLSRFFKTGPGQYGEGDQFLGIKVPQTRAIVKEMWKKCTLEDVQKLICSPYHEIRLCALLLLVRLYDGAKKDPETQEIIVRFYLSQTEFINNWDLVDLSCYEIMGKYLMQRDRSVLYDLAQDGRTIWEQRIGIVSTMAFVRAGQLDDTLAIADILLHHPHDLIQKAVGWLLREVGKKDGKLLRDWLLGKDHGHSEDAGNGETMTDNMSVRTGISDNDSILAGNMSLKPSVSDLPRYKTMPRTALRYAIERFPEEERQLWLKGML